MTNEERDLIARFVARIGGAPSGGFLNGSVPSSAPALPPIDREADEFIAQQFQQHPEARYRMTQTALVQEAALAEAQNRIQRLQWELDQARQQAQQAPQKSGGFLSGIFGGGGSAPAAPQPQRQAQGPWGQSQGYAQGQGYGQPQGYAQPAPPPPQYAPSYQPGMFGRGGSGFLGSALTTAAGVAGGMVVGNALMNAFGEHHGGGGWGNDTASAGGMFGGAGGALPADTPAGYDQGANDPFAGAGIDPGAGGMDTSTGWDGGGFGNPAGGLDAGGFDGGGFDGGGFDGGGGGGGFDDNT